MRVAYLAHPVGALTQSDVDRNIFRAMRWYRWACNTFPDRAFVANWIVDVEVFYGTDAGPNYATNIERIRGLRRDDAVIKRCDEVWLVGGEISSGMARAKARAKCLYDFTRLGPEPPWDSFSTLETFHVPHGISEAINAIDA